MGETKIPCAKKCKNVNPDERYSVSHGFLIFVVVLIAHKFLHSVLTSLSYFIYVDFSSSCFDVPVLLSLKGGRHN